MKTLLIALLLVGTVAAATFRGRPHLDTKWHFFKNKHGKTYKHSEEEGVRRQLWEKTDDKIEKHNAEASMGLHSYTLDHNELSDMTGNELKTRLGYKRPSELPSTRDSPYSRFPQYKFKGVAVPKSLDWRNHACLPAVKNQLACGSCYAFSATTPVEFQACNKTGKRMVLSESQIVDCLGDGCDGGDMIPVWYYLKNAPGQANSTVYPYYPVRNTCKYTPSKGVVNVTGGGVVPELNVSLIKEALFTIGPLSVAIVTPDELFNYGRGIIDKPTYSACGNFGDHAVVLVGYGTSSTNVSYWIVRNSWGTGFGAGGYFYVKQGSNALNLECEVFYPTL